MFNIAPATAFSSLLFGCTLFYSITDRYTFSRDTFIGIIMLDVDTPTLLDVARSSPTHNLIASVQLNLDRTTDFQGTNRRPDTPLASENPVFQTLFRGILEEFRQIFGRQIRYKCHTRPGNAFVYEQLSQARREQTKIIKLF